MIATAGEESSLPRCCKKTDLHELHSKTLCRPVIFDFLVCMPKKLTKHNKINTQTNVTELLDE